jgi:hypothetical protein
MWFATTDFIELTRFAAGCFDRSVADEIAKLFPNLFGQPSVSLVPAAEPASSAASLVSMRWLPELFIQSPKLPRPSCFGASGGDLRLMVDSRKVSAVRWRSKEYALFFQ